MNHMLSKSGLLWTTGMNWFLNISMYWAELTVWSKKKRSNNASTPKRTPNVHSFRVWDHLLNCEVGILSAPNMSILPIHIRIKMKIGLIATLKHIDIKLIIVNHLDDSVCKFQALFHWWLTQSLINLNPVLADQLRQSVWHFFIRFPLAQLSWAMFGDLSQKLGLFSQCFQAFWRSP